MPHSLAATDTAILAASAAEAAADASAATGAAGADTAVARPCKHGKATTTARVTTESTHEPKSFA